ncbi:MAG: hypothetical protein AABZ02_07405 [Bacteroidota bacterium]
MKQRHMATLNKKMRRRLRELSGLAFERELHQELSQLAKKFDLWRNNEMSSGELSNALHEYDYGLSRRLFGLYNDLKPEMTVARAVALKLLTREEVGEELLGVLEQSIRFFEENLSGS